MKYFTDTLDPQIRRATRDNMGLKKLFSRCMPTEILSQVLFVRISGDTLKITTANAALAARIRFYSRELLRVTESDHPSLRQVSVHVLPPTRTEILPRRSSRVKPGATSVTASRIRQVADDVGQDELSAALHRLARNLSE